MESGQWNTRFERRWALGGIFADTRNLIDRDWPRQEGYRHLRPGSSSPGLAPFPAAVSIQNMLSLFAILH